MRHEHAACVAGSCEFLNTASEASDDLQNQSKTGYPFTGTQWPQTTYLFYWGFKSDMHMGTLALFRTD